MESPKYPVRYLHITIYTYMEIASAVPVLINNWLQDYKHVCYSDIIVIDFVDISR